MPDYIYITRIISNCQVGLFMVVDSVVFIDWINYYIIAKHNGMAPTKNAYILHIFLYCI